MHELSIALAILDVAGEQAAQHQGRVAAIHLKLGLLAGVVKDALESAYNMARAGTELEQAELVVQEVPVIAYCPDCAAEREAAVLSDLSCPVCGCPMPEVVRGRELEVVALEIVEIVP